MTSFTALNDSWLSAAIARIEADFQRSADTHLIALPLPGFAARGIDLYLKDESTHPTGSLKHRLGGRKDGRLRGGATAHRVADAAWRPELTA